jgi:predicted ATPase
MDEPVPVWRVAGEREVESRLEALGGPNTSPLIGRDHEIALVHDRYRLAASGEGQVMLLCGEPGIGKSRIVLELRERLLGQAYTPLRYFCSPFFANTVLHPILVQLEHAARLERADSAEEKLKKIKAVLADEPAPDQEAVHLLADLLSVPQTFERAADYTPQQRKAKTFTVFMRLLERLAARQPVLMALEDAQWLDPTSAELFELLIERMQTLPVFLVVTYRQPFAPPWLGYPHVTLLTLNRLGHDQGLRLVTHGAGGKPFPKQVMEQILAKAGGIPLFIEELTRNVLESGFLLEVGDRYELGEPLPPLAIPATLQDALVARLDRLSTAKDVAQTAACIGREVPYRLLRGIVGLDKAGLDLALGRLTASDVLVRRGIGDEALYVFRDSLMQETAHQTLLKSRRQVLHARIAKTLVEQMPSTAEATPEIVARHYTEAGLSGPAIEYWLKAARSAAAKPAFKEALAHLDNGLQLLSQVEDESRRTDREIELRLASGVALHALRGPVDEVREAYARVCALCQDVGEDRRLYAGLWGLWFNSEQRMDFEEAQRLAIQLLALAEREKDEELVVQAHHSAWTTYLYRGDLSRCMDHAEHGKRLYSSEHHHANSSVYSGHDAGVCCRYTAGLAAWLRGQPDTALDHAAESIVLAEKLAHPYSLALSLTISSLISQCRGEVARTLGFADRLRAVSEDNGIAVFRATADIMHGWGIAASGDPQSGVVAIERGVDALEHMGAGLRRSYFLWLLADAYALQGRNDLALDTLDRAHDFTRQRGEQWWQAEILRRQGELLPSSASVGAQRSAPLFQQAMSLAERQGALSLSLRAATSYAQFCIANGEVEKARGLVEPAYIRLREGRDTADLHNARTLVDRLSA